MEPAAEGLGAALASTRIEDARIPIVANVTGGPVREAGEIRDALTRQLTAQVRWTDSMRYLLDGGYNQFVEVGPGKALQGMLRQLDRSVTVTGVDTPETLAAQVAEAGSGNLSP